MAEFPNHCHLWYGELNEKLVEIAWHKFSRRIHRTGTFMLTICYAKLVVVYTFYAFVNILDTLTKLFDLLIMSLFLYGIEIWGAAYQGKYLYRIDKPLLEASVQIRIHQQPVCNS